MSRVVFITGASSGLGAGLARRFASDGDRVALAARREDRLNALAQSIRQTGGEAAVFPCDVTDRAAVQHAVQQCVSQLGPVDVLVAGAGVNRPSSVDSLAAETVEKVFAVNVFGAVYAIEAVLPGMLERQSGRIVGISSLASMQAQPGFLAYSASKAALSNLLEGLRMELGGRGVDVTTVNPGFVKTEMTAEYNHDMPLLMERDEAVERIYSAILRGYARSTFPRRLAALVRVGQFLPRGIHDRIARLFFADHM